MYSLKKLIPAIVLCLLVISYNSCKPKVKEVKEKLTAEFSTDKRQVNAGEAVRFTYDSDNYDKLSWDFGDGSFSEEKNPVHVYKKEGSSWITFTVIKGRDTAVNADLKILVLASDSPVIPPDSNSVVKEVVTEKEPVKKTTTATIVIWPTTVYTGDKIGYTTNADKPFIMDFGGKSTSEAKAGEIIFDEIGQYVIKLTDKETGAVLDKKTITVLEKVDDGKISSWLTDLANDKLSRAEKTALSTKIYSYCLNRGEIPIGGKETGTLKEFVTKIMMEANPYETFNITVTLQFNANKKISGVQLVTYDKKAI